MATVVDSHRSKVYVHVGMPHGSARRPSLVYTPWRVVIYTPLFAPLTLESVCSPRSSAQLRSLRRDVRR